VIKPQPRHPLPALDSASSPHGCRRACTGRILPNSSVCTLREEGGNGPNTTAAVQHFVYTRQHPCAHHSTLRLAKSSRCAEPCLWTLGAYYRALENIAIARRPHIRPPRLKEHKTRQSSRRPSPGIEDLLWAGSLIQFSVAAAGSSFGKICTETALTPRGACCY